MPEDKKIEFLKTEVGLDDIMPNQSMGFDNDGNIVVRTRAYRRRKVQVEIEPQYLPKKKKRAKKSKKNYLNKRKK